MRRSALGAAALAVCALASCAPQEKAPPRLAARGCVLRVAGPISGQFSCEGELEREGGGWVLSARLPAGARVAASVRVPIPAAGSLPPGSELAGGQAVVREPGRAGVGVVWGGVPRGRAHLAFGVDRLPTSGEVVALLPPLRANPEEEPVLVALELTFASRGVVAGLREEKAR